MRSSAGSSDAVEGSSFSRKGSTDTEDELDGTKGELVQKDMSLLSVASDVRNAVQALPESAKLAPARLSLLSKFMRSPQDYYEDKAAAKSSYSPASTTIMGILKDMLSIFIGLGLRAFLESIG